MVNHPDSRLTGSPAKLFKFAIGFGGHVEVALRQAIDLVRPNLDLALTPGEIEVWVVTFCFRHSPHFVHVGQSQGEILKRIQALKMAGLVQRPPAPQLFQQGLRAISLNRRYTAAAGDTFVVGKAQIGRASCRERVCLAV